LGGVGSVKREWLKKYETKGGDAVMKLNMSFLRQALPYSALYVGGKNVEASLDSSAAFADLIDSNRECDISIDSRTLNHGQVFLALKGKKTDGHLYVQQAMQRGARVLIINENKKDCLTSLSPDQTTKTLVITVQDTLYALHEMAKNWRQRFDYPVIGITGSLGKTTTKEITKTILEQAGIPACISFGNLNTNIGLSLSMLKMRKEHQAAIFELGIQHKNDMKVLADILRPTTALITSIAHSHTSFLGSLLEVAQEKRDIFKYFNPNNIGIVCGDQPLIADTYYQHPVIRFGLKIKNQIQARKIKIKQIDSKTFVTMFVLKVYKEKRQVTLKGNHRGRIYNALAATSIAHYLNVPIDTIVRGLEAFEDYDRRFVSHRMKGDRGYLINDCYNANPESMRAALLAFHQMQAKGPKIAVLGDMLELGEKELFWHRQIGRILGRTMSLDAVIMVGPLSKVAEKTAPLTMNVTSVENWQEASDLLETLLQPDSLVLVKGSRGMELENLVNCFVV
jgi:UDP-N-acetylmuramoyl-tripeptide--D-alanyl-D-alanine ligase